MSFSTNQNFASLDEAYGDSKIAEPIANKMTDPSYQAQILDRLPEQYPSGVQSANVKRFITNTYAERGLPGLKELLDPVIVRDIQASVASSASKKKEKSGEFSVDEYLFILIGALVLLILVDSIDL